MEEHHVRQVKIVEALEAEKKKISNELMEIQRRRALRENQPSRNGPFFVFGERTGQIDPIIACAKISLSVSVLDIFQAELFSCAGWPSNVISSIKS